MPRPAAIDTVPEELREELHARLVGSGWSSYREHAEWLHERGYAIGRMSVWRYAQALREDQDERDREARICSVQAQSLAHAAGMDLGSGAARAIMLSLWRTLRDGADLDPERLSALALALDRSVRSSARLDALRTAERRASADVAEQAARAQGLSPDVAAAIRDAIERPPREDARASD